MVSKRSREGGREIQRSCIGVLFYSQPGFSRTQYRELPRNDVTWSRLGAPARSSFSLLHAGAAHGFAVCSTDSLPSRVGLHVRREHRTCRMPAEVTPRRVNEALPKGSSGSALLRVTHERHLSLFSTVMRGRGQNNWSWYNTSATI